MNATCSTLSDWLAHCARLHPKTMDLSLERTVEVARRLGIAFKVPLITVAGTNGREIGLALNAACKDPATLARLDTLPPAALYEAPVERRKAIVKNPETLRKLSI